MQKYFDATVQVRVESQDGKGNPKFKKVKKNYLVDSMTVTEAEARVVRIFEQMGGVQEFNVLAVTGSRIMDAILLNLDTKDPIAQHYYSDVQFYETLVEIKLESSAPDESIRVKKIKETYLIEAKNITEAEVKVKKLYTSGFSSDFEVVSIKRSKIVEIITPDTSDLKELSEGKWLTKKIEAENSDDIQDQEITNETENIL
jgi:hypothetical protein